MNFIAAIVVGILPMLLFCGFVALIIVALSNRNRREPSTPRTIKTPVVVWPYETKKTALNPAEISFFNALRQTLPSYAVICVKMNLKDCLFVKGQAGSNFQYYYKRLVYHNVDFMLLDNETYKPICGIMLQDSVVKDNKRLEMINEMKTLFANAELPLYVIEAKSSYSESELNALLGGYYQRELNRTEPAVSSKEKPVLCPKCGEDMVVRIAKSGENEGKSFYGCSKYPSCKGIVNMY